MLSKKNRVIVKSCITSYYPAEKVLLSGRIANRCIPSNHANKSRLLVREDGTARRRCLSARVPWSGIGRKFWMVPPRVKRSALENEWQSNELAQLRSVKFICEQPSRNSFTLMSRIVRGDKQSTGVSVGRSSARCPMRRDVVFSREYSIEVHANAVFNERRRATIVIQ